MKKVNTHLIKESKQKTKGLTRKLHKLVKVDDGEDRFSEFTKIKFENSGHRVDVRGVRHVGQRIVAAFERVSEIVYLNLKIRKKKINYLLCNLSYMVLVRLFLFLYDNKSRSFFTVKLTLTK